MINITWDETDILITELMNVQIFSYIRNALVPVIFDFYDNRNDYNTNNLIQIFIYDHILYYSLSLVLN